MPNIFHKRSLTTGSIPTTSSLSVGEIAINVPDGKIYIHKSGSVSDSIESAITSNSTSNIGTLLMSGSLVISGSDTSVNSGSVFDVSAQNVSFDFEILEFTGSAYVTGSFQVNKLVATGSLLGTASYAATAQTASYVLNAVSASFASSASYYGGTITSASYALTSSYAAQALTSSYASNGGVTQIVAGTNVSLTPSTGVGAVTINASINYGAGSNTTASFSNASSWVFNHNLNTQYPVIQTYDLNYNQIIPQSIVLTNLNTTTITFPGNESGYAIASVGGVGVTAATASYVNTLNQNTIITGSLTVGALSSGINENTLTLGPAPAGGTGEGGQLSLQAQGGSYTSASFLDTWQNYFRILRGTNTGGSSAQLIGLDLQTGNLSVAGTVAPSAWAAGQVIKDTILSNSDVTISTTTVATSTSDTDFLTYSYTPVSSNSYLIIHYHLASYDFSSGTGNDSYFSRIKVDGTEITYSSQSTVNGNRSGVLFPLTGRYTNSSTAAKSIVVACRRNSADDSITIVNTATSMWLRITEIGR